MLPVLALFEHHAMPFCMMSEFLVSPDEADLVAVCLLTPNDDENRWIYSEDWSDLMSTNLFQLLVSDVV